jgi:hypothetical protein
MQVGAAHAFVDHVLKAHAGLPAHVHADVDEHRDDAGVLADRSVALGAHARVDEDLRHGVACRLALLTLPGAVHGLDEIHRVVVGNELQRVSHAVDQVVLANDSHGTSGLLLQC